MRPLIKSLLIAFCLYIILIIIGFSTTEPLGWAYLMAFIFPILAVFMVIGGLIGFSIEKSKGYKPKRRTYVGWVGLICAVVVFLLTYIWHRSLGQWWSLFINWGSMSGFILGSILQPVNWPFWGFIIGALITLIIEKIKK